MDHGACRQRRSAVPQWPRLVSTGPDPKAAARREMGEERLAPLGFVAGDDEEPIDADHRCADDYPLQERKTEHRLQRLGPTTPQTASPSGSQDDTAHPHVPHLRG